MKLRLKINFFIFFLLSFFLHTFFIIGCSFRLVPIDGINKKESNGITVLLNLEETRLKKDDLITPIYITIRNNTPNKIKFSNSNFILFDDNNNQYNSIPLKDVISKVTSTNTRQQNKAPYNPFINNFSPLGLPFPYLSTSPYIYYKDLKGDFQLFPYPISTLNYYNYSPFLYYKDMNDNYQILPISSTFNQYTLPNTPLSHDPEYSGLNLDNMIYPNYQVQGFIYFNHATKFVKNKLKLIIENPIDANSDPIKFILILK